VWRSKICSYSQEWNVSKQNKEQAKLREHKKFGMKKELILVRLSMKSKIEIKSNYTLFY